MNKKIIGIYKISNLVNDKIYIGSSMDVDKRIKRHYNELRKDKHYNEYLQRAWNKYGEINFVYDILEILENKNDLIHKEQYYIDKYKSYNILYGYNLCPKAYVSLGYKHTEDVRNKMSVDRKKNGYKYARYGKNHWKFGKTISDEQKKILTESRANIDWEKSKLAKLRNVDVIKIRELFITKKYTYKNLGKEFGVSDKTIARIIKRERWKNI